MLGSHVVYRANKDHHTKTIVGKTDEGKDVEVEGSIHHRELREFAGLVTRVYPGGKKGEPSRYDLVIFPPGHAPVHVESVREGTGDNEVELVNA